MLKVLIKSINFILILQLVDHSSAQTLQYESPGYNSHYVVNSPIKVVPYYNDVSSSPHQVHHHHHHQYQQPLVQKSVQRPPYLMYHNIQPLYFTTSSVIPYGQQQPQQQQLLQNQVQGTYQAGPQQYQQQQDSYSLKNYRGNSLLNNNDNNNNELSQYNLNPQPLSSTISNNNNNQFQELSTVDGGALPQVTFQNQNNINQQYQQNQYVGSVQQQQQPTMYRLPTTTAPFQQQNFVQSYSNLNNNNGFLLPQGIPVIGGFGQTLNNNNNYNNGNNFQYNGATFSTGPSNFGYEVSGPGVISQYQFSQSSRPPGPSAPPAPLPQYGFSSSSPVSGPSGPGSFPQSASSNTASVVEQFPALDKTQEFEDLRNAIIAQQTNNSRYASVDIPSPSKNVKAKNNKGGFNSSQGNSQRSPTTISTTTKRPKTSEKQKNFATTTSSPVSSTSSSESPEVKAFGQRLSPVKSIRNLNKNSAEKSILAPKRQTN